MTHSETSKRLLLIHNPAAGQRGAGRLRAVRRQLAALGWTVVARTTQGPGDVGDALDDVDTFDRLAVAGGDGTVNDVVNAATDALPPLAFVPMGTANVLAWELGLPRRAAALARTIDAGRTKTTRLGRANGRRFVLMVSVGLDAWAVRAVHGPLKAKVGAIAYIAAALRMARGYPWPRYVATVDGTESAEGTIVVASRARCYGGPFRLVPDADIGSDRLRVVVLREAGFIAMLRYGIALARGTLATRADVTVLTGTSATIDGPQGDPAQIDGDDADRVPVAVEPDDLTVELIIP